MSKSKDTVGDEAATPIAAGADLSAMTIPVDSIANELLALNEDMSLALNWLKWLQRDYPGNEDVLAAIAAMENGAIRLTAMIMAVKGVTVA